jgi:hypothetical protein
LRPELPDELDDPARRGRLDVAREPRHPEVAWVKDPDGTTLASCQAE